MHRPYDLVAHTFLLAQGYVHSFEEATWEDVGGPEEGPRVVGGPACDVYTSDTEYVVIDEDGRATIDKEARANDLTYEKMEAAWLAGQSA